MLYGTSNVQLGCDILKTHYQHVLFISEVEDTMSLFFNDNYKIPIVLK